MKRYDEKKIYCKMLGHHLHFEYCRKTVDDKPCHRIADCWYEFLPIVDYINENFSDEQKEMIAQRPPAKMDTLLDLINKAKERSAKNKKETPEK